MNRNSASRLVEEQKTKDEDTSLIRVLIVSDSHITRSGLRRILDSLAGFRVLAEVSVEKAVAFDTVAQHPDLVLVELDSRGSDALGFISSLRSLKKDSPVLVLSDLADHELSRRALALGAAGVVLKIQPAAVLIAAIKELCQLNGDESLPNDLTRRGREPNIRRVFQTSTHTEDARKIDSLTAREREIISLVGRGMKNKEIANRLSISDITVRHHLTSIFCKLEVEDRQKLLILAHRNGLADLTLSTESA
jgi:DNA-binding NarL/FixJ family response regulator